jgi:hypothetical protein
MDEELTNMMNDISVNTDDEGVDTNCINNISLSEIEDIKEIRSKRALEYFTMIMSFINNENNIEFQKIDFLQKMTGVIGNYYKQIYEVNNWEQYYIDNGFSENLPEYRNIKVMMESFLSYCNNDYDNFLILLKNIYIKMFIVSDCFHEFHGL